jgi:MYXO-CTERM domain-containing protein
MRPPARGSAVARLVPQAGVVRMLASTLASMLVAFAPGAAWAKKNGIAAAGCGGCHSGGQSPTVVLTAIPANPPVGQPVTVTVSISPANGSCAGFYLTTDGPNNGTFRAIDSGTAVLPGGVGHTMPRTTAGAGPITFTAEWTASQATGVEFAVFALACNDDGRSSGDGAGSAELALVSGCAGMSYFIDQDGDGYGTTDPGYPVRKDCVPVLGYATVSGDCNDFVADVHPGAPELCDGKDNNCNGQIDEGVVDTLYCEDKDGDGYGVLGGATRMDCKPTPGFGSCSGDCNDNDPTVHPGAMEVCDGKDNNCNGQTDEGVRMTCGLGWCRRYAQGCTSICMPGPPVPETCNLFDDDCDGVIDNGTDEELCGASGLTCVSGVCVAPGGMSVGGPSNGNGNGSSGGAAPGAGAARPVAAPGGGGCSVPTREIGSPAGEGWLGLLAVGLIARARRRRTGPQGRR